jgi:uncharacterized membrane protein YfcA
MIALALIALLAFTVEGAIGFGGTVIAVSLGAQFVPLELLLPAYVPLNIALSLSLLRRRSIEWRILLVEIVPIVAIGAAAGIALSHVITSHALLVVFGVVIVALSIFQLAKPLHIWPAPLLALGGIVHGLFGTGGPMIVYVARRKIADKTAFRSTLAVLWIALNTVLVVNFTAMERYPSALTLAMAIGIIPGIVVGERLHRALDTKQFERVVWVVLALAGIALVGRVTI